MQFKEHDGFAISHDILMRRTKEAAALTEDYVAPFNRDSGKYRGKRFIQGGRAAIRKVLYMAAVSSMRCNSDMKLFYQRLSAKGKPAKVILVAIIRKLLITMNSIIKRQTPWVEKII